MRAIQALKSKGGFSIVRSMQVNFDIFLSYVDD